MKNPWMEQAARCETPAYLADPDKLLSNLTELRDAVCAEYDKVTITYCVKANPLAAFVTRASQAGFHPEVMSAAELDYALGLGASPSRIVLNGPSKKAELLSRALSDSVYVNLDSIEELETVANLGLNQVPVGVRIAMQLASGAIGRFGIDLSSDYVRTRAAELVEELNVVGVQVHHSSERSADSYVRRLNRAVDAAADLGLARLDVVDLGGGFASKMPEWVRDQLVYDVATYDEYGKAIGKRAHELFEGGVRLILEPGIGVLADTMSYVCSVQAIKRRSDQVIAMLDGSIFEVNPLRSRVGPQAAVIDSERDSTTQTTQLFGGTGMEYDHLGAVKGSPEVGDRIVFSNVGAYTLTLGPDFIVPRSPVVDVRTGRCLRERQSLSSVGGINVADGSALPSC